MLQPWPASEAARRQPAVESEMRWLMDFILAVRQIRGEMDIAPSRRFDVLLAGASAEDLARLARGRHFLERLANLGSLRPLAAAEPEPESAVALLGALRILVPMAGLIDVAAEAARLDKRIGKLRQDLGKTEAKLGNPSFVANAPAAVVEQERARVAEFRRELDGLEAQLARVRRLAGPPA